MDDEIEALLHAAVICDLKSGGDKGKPILNYEAQLIIEIELTKLLIRLENNHNAYPYELAVR